MLATRMQMAAAGGGLSEDLLPWLINIDVFMTAISHTNWDTNYAGNTNEIYSAVRGSSSAQNDEINFDVVLAAGTWTVEVIHRKDATSGIMSVQFDGVQKGTIDAYNGSTTFNNRSSVAGVAVATTGKVRLKLKVTSKNASSGSYGAYIQHIQLKRTA